MDGLPTLIDTSIQRPALREHIIAALVDDPLGLEYRRGDCVIAARVGVGPHEAMRLELAADLLLDDARRLILAVRRVWGGADAKTFVFDSRRVRRAACACAGQTLPQRLEGRQHRSPPHMRPLLYLTSRNRISPSG